MVNHQEILLGAKVPQEWLNQFEELAKQTGRSLTELVREALAQYIGVQENLSSGVSQLKAFEAELALLKQKVASLESYKHQVTQLTLRLGAIEQVMVQAQTQAITPSTSSFSDSLLIETGAIDDVDDEPDEVLRDFLPG